MRRLVLIASVVGIAAACSSFGENDGNVTPTPDVDGGDGGSADGAADGSTVPFTGPATEIAKSAAPISIATDGDTVYWTDRVDGVVRAAPKAGGATRTVSGGGEVPDYLVADGDNLYWLQTRPGCPSHEHLLVHAKAQTGNATALWGNDAQCYSTYRMATGKGALFFYVQRDNVIVEVSKSTGNRTDRAGNENIISGMAGDGLAVYWTGQNSIRKYEQGGGGATPFVENLESPPTEIAIDNTNVFWTDQKGNLFRVDRNNGKAIPQPLTSGLGAQRIALDAQNVYWTDKTASAVKSVPKQGGTVRTLATDQSGPFALAVDDSGIFWSNLGDGTIHAIKR